MPEDKKTQLPTLISVLALFVAVLLVIFFIVPKTSELKVKSTEVAAKRQELELGKKKVVAIREAIKLIASAKKEVDALNVSIPRSPSADEALVQIQEMAAQAQVTIMSASVGSTSDGYQSIPVTISGSYLNILSFLEKMLENLRPVKISGFTLASEREMSQVTLSVNLEFPYLEQVKDKAVGEEGEAAPADIGEGEQQDYTEDFKENAEETGSVEEESGN